jgi:hypothetical protein
MIINLVVIFFILIIGKLYSNGSSVKINSDKNRKKYICLISIILILQSGLRNLAVGDDTYAYYKGFKYRIKTSWGDVYSLLIDYYQSGLGKDPGYKVFEKCVQFVTEDYQVFLFIIAIMFFGALGNFIYKNTSRLNDAIIAFVIYSVLFYSFFSITGIRQTIATAATLYGYELIKKNKLVAFLLLILLASSIHISALIFLPFYFLTQIKNIKYFFIGVLLFFPIFMVFRNYIGVFFNVFGGYEQYNQDVGSGAYTLTIMFLLIAILALWRIKIILKNNNNAKHFYVALALVLLFLPLSWINSNALRIVMYFSIFLLLFIPEILYSFQTVSNKIRKDITRFTVLLLVLLYLKSNWNTDRPYGFFWQEMPLLEQYDQYDYYD